EHAALAAVRAAAGEPAPQRGLERHGGLGRRLGLGSKCEESHSREKRSKPSIPNKTKLHAGIARPPAVQCCAAIHCPSFRRSSSVMPVWLPSGIALFCTV